MDVIHAGDGELELHQTQLTAEQPPGLVPDVDHFTDHALSEQRREHSSIACSHNPSIA